METLGISGIAAKLIDFMNKELAEGILLIVTGIAFAFLWFGLQFGFLHIGGVACP